MIILAMGHMGLWGQNLVPNPGFDDLIWCPDDLSQIYAANDWMSASDGTPDLYNECSDNERIRVPNAGRWIGSYQLQRSGKGYAGIRVYSNAGFALEYLQCPLAQVMKSEQVYYIEFYVSPDISPMLLWCYTDAIGLAFSDNEFYRELLPWEVLPLDPAIEHRGTFITDTTGWTRVSGCYRASGEERFAIIGNFRSVSETGVIVEDPNVWPYSSYYYVEDVLIMKFDPLPDTVLLCPGEAVRLNAGFLDGSYQWNMGAQDSVITVDRSGIYRVEVFMDNCVLRDSVVVLGVADVMGFPDDTVVCAGAAHVLSAPVYGDYAWSTGETGGSISVAGGGWYGLTVTNTCGVYDFGTTVHVEACDCQWYAPNVISLNRDGLNETLELSPRCDFPHSIDRFEVFDRWGNRVHADDRPDMAKWTGTYPDGTLAPAGVYVWRLLYAYVRDGMERQEVVTGDVTVLR